MQGLFKFGFYEVFKILYANILGEVPSTLPSYIYTFSSTACLSVFTLPPLVLQENAYSYRTSLYLAASASAEFFADIALAPMEAVKVRVQTGIGWGHTLRECAPKLYREEGITG